VGPFCGLSREVPAWWSYLIVGLGALNEAMRGAAVPCVVSGRCWLAGPATRFQCDGLDPGLYTYERGALRRTPMPIDKLKFLCASAGTRTASGPADIVILLHADLAPLFRRYDSIAYALLLKDTGIVMQTIYLVATDLKIPVRAIGTGPARPPWAKDDAADTHVLVGELIIGPLRSL
jgi:hypothetical protein